MWEEIFLLSFMCLLTAILFSKFFFHIQPNEIKFHLFFFIYYLSCSLVCLVLLPFFLLRPKSVYNAKFGAAIMKHITKLYGLKWELRRGEILAEERGAIVVSNHQSSLDALGLYNIWELADKLTVVVKKELLYIMPFGLAAYLAGIIFIDRRNSKHAYDQLKITTDVMVKEKTKIWLFPEGTRNKDCTSFLPFKKGAFHMAIAAQVPVIPVVFSPYYFLNNEKGILNKGHVVIQCLNPIPTKGLTLNDVEKLTNQVREKMLAVYKDLYKEVTTNMPSGYSHTKMG
ncbi:unnamed protein product [Parnassius mnemosyne]|uniref:1-acyl-sn-glycerol-3-phosphate acyltransferase n=1 Tax=Parnassius mnemosyne TaxID=213953 RepID=A0AAV1M015_9NEOP